MKKKLIQIRASEDEIAILNLLANIKKCSKSEVIRDVYINYALDLTGLDKKSNIQTLLRELRNMSINVYEIQEIITKMYNDALVDKCIGVWPLDLDEDKNNFINLYSDIDEIKEIKFVHIEDLNFAFRMSLIDDYVVAKTDFRELILKFAFNKNNMFCFILTFDDNIMEENETKSSTFFDFTVIKENSFEKFQSKILDTLKIYTEDNKETDFINSSGEDIKFLYFLKNEVFSVFNSLKIYE